LKHKAKRLRNRVADVTKSREKWRTEVEQLRQQVRRCEEELATLKAQSMQAEAKKKSAARPVGAAG
jgi:phage shock protein A